MLLTTHTSVDNHVGSVNVTVVTIARASWVGGDDLGPGECDQVIRPHIVHGHLRVGVIATKNDDLRASSY